ncbi:nicotinamide N-methyltransferase-like [Pelobates cultripes]|uniref:Nicotinamide N-methyltransferase-like n=1 Tax=Pelobates cultripes TaxID=61616 RepID=A0AAD1T2H8_PELCU|nr:nicotinamide N-methyltransferase-like [Pelobates cultripes]
MEGMKHKHYHDEEFDHHLIIETYVGRDKTDTKEELLISTLQKVFQCLCSVICKGIVKGETLIDLTIGATFCQLMVMSDFFKEITILDSSDRTLNEMEKWLNKEPGAVDWSHAAEISREMKGVSPRHLLHNAAHKLVEAEEEKVRRIVKRCLKWDPTNDNPLGSVILPQADCAISIWYFDIACKDHENYRNSFRKFSSLVKVGGHLILFAFFNATYYTIGDHRFSFLNYNEDFVKEALRDNGFLMFRCHQGVQQEQSCQEEEHSSGFTSEHLEAEEEKVRSIVKHCLKWDPTNDNPLGSVVLPQIDCAVSAWYFDVACKDQDSYRNSFKKFLSLVKVGGHLILFALFNGTYYTIGDHRFSLLNYNEDFVKEVLQDNGFTIVICEVYESKLSTDLIDYKQTGYIVARKESEI